MSDSTPNDFNTPDKDPHPGFDPETDLASDGELSFDVPYKRSLNQPLSPRESIFLTRLTLAFVVVSLIACAITVILTIVINQSTLDNVDVRRTQRARSTEIAINRDALLSPTITPGIPPCAFSISGSTSPVLLVDTVDEGRMLYMNATLCQPFRSVRDAENLVQIDISPISTTVAILRLSPTTGEVFLMIKSTDAVLFPLPFNMERTEYPAITGMAWSPNGQELVVASFHTGRRDLHILNIVSQELVALTNDDEQEISVAWSPDGSQIAYVTRADQGSFNVFMLDRATRRITPLPLHADEILWSPLGDQLALRVGASTLILVDLPFDRDSVPRRINLFSGVQSIAAWSPEGSQIALLADDTVRLFNLADQTVSPVPLPDSVTRVLDADW